MYDWGIFSKRKTCGSTDKPSCVTGVNSCRSLLLSGSLLLRKEWAVSADMILLGCCGDCLQSRASLSLWAEMCLKKSVCFKYSCIVLPCTDKGGCFLLEVSLVSFEKVAGTLADSWWTCCWYCVVLQQNSSATLFMCLFSGTAQVEYFPGFQWSVV